MVKMKALKDLHAPSGFVPKGEVFEIDEESAQIHESKGSAERINKPVEVKPKTKKS